MNATTTAKAVGLWGCGPDGVEVSIPVIGVTGEYQSGKTLFCCTIAPGNRADGTARTLVYDLELSSKGYLGLGFDRIDVPEEVRASPAVNGGAYKPIDLFRWWLKHILSIPAGKYDVIAVDPINDLESGLVDYVKADHAKYGFASADSFAKTGGIFWNAVRAEWKALLANIATRCQTFAFTAHLRQVWSGGSPTRDKKPAGKSTLAELASLYLWLERTGEATAPRCGRKEKDRMSFTGIDDNGDPAIVPILPPAFDVCTPKRIREYIAKPANYAKLAKSERIIEKPLDEAERLQLELAKANAEQAASENKLALAIRQQELRDAMAEQHAKSTPKVDEAASRQAKAEAAAVKDAETATAADSPPIDPLTREMNDRVACEIEERRFQSKNVEEPPFDVPAEQPQGDRQKVAELVADLLTLKRELAIPDDRWLAGIQKNTGGSDNPMDLSIDAATRLLEQLRGVKRQRAASGN